LKKIQENSNVVTKVQWCQRKAGKFAVLAKDSNELSVHSLKHLNEDGDNLSDRIEKLNDCNLKMRDFGE
jgi:hypothetical protein